MKTLITIIILLFTVKSVENNHFDKDICFDDDLMIDDSIADFTLLYYVCYGEARSEGEAGVKLVIETIKNRIDSKHYPSTLDSVLSQPYQYHIDTTLVVKEKFKVMVDSLYQLKVVTPYLHFVNFDNLKKIPKWVKKKKWKKHGRHSFA